MDLKVVNSELASCAKADMRDLLSSKLVVLQVRLWGLGSCGTQHASFLYISGTLLAYHAWLCLS